jgi:hypothetical protein
MAQKEKGKEARTQNQKEKKREREGIYLKQLSKRSRTGHQVCPCGGQLRQMVGNIKLLHHLIR